MFTGITNHVSHPVYLFGESRTVNHGVGDRIVTFGTVTIKDGSIMDSSNDVRPPSLIMAGQAGRGRFG